MKKLAFYMLMLVMGIGYAHAQGQADIKFDKTTHNFGTFSESSPVVSCTFTFTNVGDAPLVIHQAVASCGCTVPEYTQEPVMPGKKGTIKIVSRSELLTTVRANTPDTSRSPLRCAAMPRPKCSGSLWKAT